MLRKNETFDFDDSVTVPHFEPWKVAKREINYSYQTDSDSLNEYEQ